MSKRGGGDYPKGVQLSPLNELSDELSYGSNGKVVAEIYLGGGNVDSSAGGSCFGEEVVGDDGWWWSKLLLCGFVSPTPSFLPQPTRHSSFLCY